MLFNKIVLHFALISIIQASLTSHNVSISYNADESSIHI